MALVLAAALLTGCGGSGPKVKEIKEYFFDAGTYTSLDYEFANDYFAQSNDNWGGGCTAVSAVIGDQRLVGRNMDLNISDKCAYVVRTKLPGKYETFGLAYTFRDVSPDYEDVKKNGTGETFAKLLPFMCDDVMNSEGLHIEINMRHGETDAEGNDIFGAEHTNPGAAERIYVFTLGQYVGLNCATLDDVKAYLENDVDIYSQKYYWNYSFIVTDAAGNSALLEFGNGKYYWTGPDASGVVAQANFYVNGECRALEQIPTGLGRYDAVMDGIGSVTDRHGLYELMKKIEFSSLYLPYQECFDDHFDPRSEVIGEDDYLTYEFMMDSANTDYIIETMDEAHAPVRAMSRQEKQALNELWESTFTEVVDPAGRTIEVRLFENEDYLYRIDFDGIKAISEIG